MDLVKDNQGLISRQATVQQHPLRFIQIPVKVRRVGFVSACDQAERKRRLTNLSGPTNRSICPQTWYLGAEEAAQKIITQASRCHFERYY